MLIMIHGTKDLWVVCTDITVLGPKLLYIPADGTVKRDSIPH